MRESDVSIRCNNLIRDCGGTEEVQLLADEVLGEVYGRCANCLPRFFCLAYFLREAGLTKRKLLEIGEKILIDCPKFKEEKISMVMKVHKVDVESYNCPK